MCTWMCASVCLMGAHMCTPQARALKCVCRNHTVLRFISMVVFRSNAAHTHTTNLMATSLPQFNERETLSNWLKNHHQSIPPPLNLYFFPLYSFLITAVAYAAMRHTFAHIHYIWRQSPIFCRSANGIGRGAQNCHFRCKKIVRPSPLGLPTKGVILCEHRGRGQGADSYVCFRNWRTHTCALERTRTQSQSHKKCGFTRRIFFSFACVSPNLSVHDDKSIRNHSKQPSTPIPLFRRVPGNFSVRVCTTRYGFHADSRLCQWQKLTYFPISLSAPDKIHATQPTLFVNHSIQAIVSGSLIVLRWMNEKWLEIFTFSRRLSNSFTSWYSNVIWKVWNDQCQWFSYTPHHQMCMFYIGCVSTFMQERQRFSLVRIEGIHRHTNTYARTLTVCHRKRVWILVLFLSTLTMSAFAAAHAFAC